MPEELTKGAVKPNAQASPGPIGNTQGIIVPKTATNPDGDSAPPPEPQPKEEGWWKRWGSDWTHNALDVVGLIPVAGELSDGANALIYLAEGDKINAAISLTAMAPLAGDAVTAGKWALKGVKKIEKEALKEAEEAAAKKLAKEAEEAAAKKAAKEAEEDALKKVEENAAKKGGYVNGPCQYLKKGNPEGVGPYRGGSYGGTTKHGIESHHLPADSISPLPKSQGPAIQMHPDDHPQTSSHGHQGADGAVYRSNIAQKIKNGKWRDAIAEEIKDIKRIAQESGDPSRYNEAIKEMLEYFKCLKRHKLLP